MKKAIGAAGKLISGLFPVTVVILLLADAAYIAGDIITGWGSRLSHDQLVYLGITLGQTGVVFASIAFSYYVLRALFVLLAKHRVKFPPSVDGWIKTIISFLRLIHPTAGIAAIVLLSSHGYTMFIKLFDLSFNIFTVSGMTAYALAATLAVYGFMLYLRQNNKQFRKIHFALSLVFVFLVLTHITVISFLG